MMFLFWEQVFFIGLFYWPLEWQHSPVSIFCQWNPIMFITLMIQPERSCKLPYWFYHFITQCFFYSIRSLLKNVCLIRLQSGRMTKMNVTLAKWKNDTNESYICKVEEWQKYMVHLQSRRKGCKEHCFAKALVIKVFNY